MDEFDDMLKQSKQTYTPSAHFTEDTMKKVNVISAYKTKGWKLWAPSLVAVGAIAAFAFLAVPNWLTGTGVNNNAPSPTGSSSNVTSDNTLPAGTDNQSLQNDLSDIQSSQSQETSDQSNADSMLNDSSQQIAVPTD